MAITRKLRQKVRDGSLREMWQEMKWIFAYIRRYRAAVGIHILLGILGTALSLLSSVAMKTLIDVVTGFETGAIWSAAAWMAGLLLGSAAMQAAASRIAAVVDIRVQNGIQAEVYDRILRTDWVSLEQFRSGDLLNRLNTDVGAVAGGVTGLLPSFVSAAVQFLGSLIIILCYDPVMALIALIGAPLSVLCSRTLGALLGAASLLVAHAIESHKERARHTNMTLTATETQFLHIVKVAVSGGEIPAENVDWPAVFALAGQQKLLPLVFEAARTTPAAAENAALFASVKQQVVAQVLSQTVRAEAFAALYQKLRAAGLHPVVVKGRLCSRLYPLEDHRISADDDLYIPDGEFPACHEALLENGLTTDTPENELATADEVSYTKKGSPLYIELHRRLFDSAEDAHDDLNRFFSDLQPVEIDGFLAMPPHEHLLYLILHAYKHFVGCGIGLRQFCDIGLWARAYHDQIDWQRLYDQCECVHAATFARAAFCIARDGLGIAFALPAPWDAAIDTEPLLHDTLCGGVYGSNDYTRLHSSTVTINAVKASRTGERSGVLRTVFPKRAYLERRYPYLQKRPYLLPAAWLARMVHYAAEKRSGADNSAAGSIRLARERIALMRYYDILGGRREP